MTILITLVIPIGGDAGPFNLFSNTDGYTVPFQTNVPATVLQAGYTTSLVPDGTTIIRVTSVGVCTNFIDIPVDLVPTTTTTSSSSTSTSTSTSTSSTSTSTSTSTTAVPTTTTTTTVSGLCKSGTIYISPLDIAASSNNTVYLTYQECGGHQNCPVETLSGPSFTQPGTYVNAICYRPDSLSCPPAAYILEVGSPIATLQSYILENGACGVGACSTYRVGQTFGFDDHVVIYIDCADGLSKTVTVAPGDPDIYFCASSIVLDSSPSSTDIFCDCFTGVTGCYSVMLTNMVAGVGCPGHVNFDYVDCNGVPQSASVSVSESFHSFCHLYGTAPTITCGTGTFIITGPCNPTPSELGLISTSNDPTNACGLAMPTTCYLVGAGVGGAINLSTFVFTDALLTTPFVGDGINYYHVTSQLGTYSYSAQINSVGQVIGIISICP